MRIDERLERLTERHEARAQSLELLSIDIREARAVLAETTANVTASKTVGVLAQSVFELVGIVRGHGKRIANLRARRNVVNNRNWGDLWQIAV